MIYSGYILILDVFMSYDVEQNVSKYKQGRI